MANLVNRALIIVLACLAVAALGVGGWLALRGDGDESEQVKAHAKLMEELAAKRDHVTIVISGRLMAEIYPCG
jgi:hypothetical protein